MEIKSIQIKQLRRWSNIYNFDHGIIYFVLITPFILIELGSLICIILLELLLHALAFGCAVLCADCGGLRLGLCWKLGERLKGFWFHPDMCLVDSSAWFDMAYRKDTHKDQIPNDISIPNNSEVEEENPHDPNLIGIKTTRLPPRSRSGCW